MPKPRTEKTRERSQAEKDRQQFRQRCQRLLAKCHVYGVQPWEFYYWLKLKEIAADWMKARAEKRVHKNYSLREWIARDDVYEDAYKQNLLTILERMGKVTGFAPRKERYRSDASGLGEVIAQWGKKSPSE